MNAESPTPSSPRIPRHDTGDREACRSAITFSWDLRRVILERTPVPIDGRSLFRCDIERAGLSSPFEDESATLFAAITLGAGAAAAAGLCQTRWHTYRENGVVVLSEPNREPRRIPTGYAEMVLPEWVGGFALAALARDADALAILCRLECINACGLPPDRLDGFWPFYCGALASAAVEPQATAAFADDAERALPSFHIADPNVIEYQIRPTLALARSLATGEPNDFKKKLRAALEAHRRFYEAPERRHDPHGFLAFTALALSSLAFDRGLAVEVESDYLPLVLVRGEFPRTLSRLNYDYTRRSIVSADEAHWFLDLEGFPSEKRSHRLLELDNRLVARYEAGGAPGLPHASAEFVLVEPEQLAGHEDADVPPPALDVGELLFIAEVLASTTDGGEGIDALRKQRAQLANAVACMDIALARIPPGEEAASAETITSRRGRQLYESEPGRFRLDRMTAYRDALNRVLERFDAEIGRKLPAGEEPEQQAGLERAGDGVNAEARASAAMSIEVIRSQVAPLLEALARDRSGAVARMFRPQPDDYAKVFVGDAVKVARRAYEAMWDAELKIDRPRPEQSVLRTFFAPAGMLAEENELSWNFPGGYRAIARFLNPHRVWVRWKYVGPGETSGLAYDGLVWCDDHWAWFPKPYRVLKGLLG